MVFMRIRVYSIHTHQSVCAERSDRLRDGIGYDKRS